MLLCHRDFMPTFLPYESAPPKQKQPILCAGFVLGCLSLLFSLILTALIAYGFFRQWREFDELYIGQLLSFADIASAGLSLIAGLCGLLCCEKCERRARVMSIVGISVTAGWITLLVFRFTTHK
jgi:hypothetical protein